MIRLGNAPFNVEAVTPAGSAQADAAAIPARSSPALVCATGNGTAGILLPPAVEGKAYFIKNEGGSALLVYPTGIDTINALAPSGAISMAANTSALFAAKDSVKWYTVPLLPS